MSSENNKTYTTRDGSVYRIEPDGRVVRLKDGAEEQVPKHPRKKDFTRGWIVALLIVISVSIVVIVRITTASPTPENTEFIEIDGVEPAVTSIKEDIQTPAEDIAPQKTDTVNVRTQSEPQPAVETQSVQDSVPTPAADHSENHEDITGRIQTEALPDSD